MKLWDYNQGKDKNLSYSLDQHCPEQKYKHKKF